MIAGTALEVGQMYKVTDFGTKNKFGKLLSVNYFVVPKIFDTIYETKLINYWSLHHYYYKPFRALSHGI